MADRNALLCARARTRGIELSSEDRAIIQSAENAAKAAEVKLVETAVEIKRLKEALAAAEAIARPLREQVKPLRERADGLLVATINTRMREARMRELQADLAKDEARVAAKRAALAALGGCGARVA